MADTVRDFEAYLHVLRGWGSPDEVRRVLREIGSIDDATDRHRALEELLLWLTPERRAEIVTMIAEAEYRASVWRFVRTAIAWCIGLITLLATLKSIVPAGVLPW